MGSEFPVDWLEVTIDCLSVATVARFWSQLLGLSMREPPLPGWARSDPTVPGGPVLTFQPVPEPKICKSRVHLDLRTDDLQSAVRRVCELGRSCRSSV